MDVTSTLRSVGIAFVASFIFQKVDYRNPSTQQFTLTLYVGTIAAALLLYVVIRARIIKRSDETVLLLKGEKHGLRKGTEKEMTHMSYDLSKNQTEGLKLLGSIAVTYFGFHTTGLWPALVMHSLLTIAMTVSDPLFKIHILDRDAAGDLARPFGMADLFDPEGPVRDIGNGGLRGVLKESKNRLVVIDFFASWCGPCKMLTPHLVDIAGRERQVRFFHCNIDDEDSPARELGVSAVPTLQFYKNGRLVTSLSGPSVEAVEQAIAEHK